MINEAGGELNDAAKAFAGQDVQGGLALRQLPGRVSGYLAG